MVAYLLLVYTKQASEPVFQKMPDDQLARDFKAFLMNGAPKFGAYAPMSGGTWVVDFTNVVMVLAEVVS
jgi:hypothetical protein